MSTSSSEDKGSLLESNPRGIPKAPFVEDVEKYVSESDADTSLKKLQEMLAKYRYMNENTMSRKQNLEEKIVELDDTLQLIGLLRDRKEDDDDLVTTFELSDTLYTQATLNPTKEVYLWLGANVMLAYPIDEAKDLLEDKLKTAKRNLQNAGEDIEFLRAQMTVAEVNVARVYNWDVKRRREERERLSVENLSVKDKKPSS